MKSIKMVGVIMTLLVSNTGMAEKMSLPAPKQFASKTLVETLNKRASSREYSDKALDNNVLSEILWVAYGKNAHGTRTIPTANNKLNLKVYAAMSNGVWLYDGDKHSLEQVVKKDLRKMLAKQDFVEKAPLTLVFVGSDREYSPLHAGSSYQNVGLYAASKGLGAVVRGYFDKDEVKKELKLSKDEFVVITQTIGWLK